MCSADQMHEGLIDASQVLDSRAWGVSPVEAVHIDCEQEVAQCALSSGCSPGHLPPPPPQSTNAG